MRIDPRLQQRRKDVEEDRARVDVRRVVWFLSVLGAVGLAFCLVTSPMLSVQTIAIFGATNAQVSVALEAQEVVEGRPLVAIRSERVAEAIETDPWVRSAGVELVFPSHVEVTVSERLPAAWVPSGRRWALVADDGVVVAFADEPDVSAPVVQIPAASAALGKRVDEQEILGSVVFLDALADHLVARTTLRLSGGEVWAFVADRNVRLGRPIDMDAKAAALMAIIGSAPPGVIDVIAPSRPAVWADEADVPNPDGKAEGEDESFTDG
jgi:cell division protein FtsQ